MANLFAGAKIEQQVKDLLADIDMDPDSSKQAVTQLVVGGLAKTYSIRALTGDQMTEICDQHTPTANSSLEWCLQYQYCCMKMNRNVPKTVMAITKSKLKNNVDKKGKPKTVACMFQRDQVLTLGFLTKGNKPCSMDDMISIIHRYGCDGIVMDAQKVQLAAAEIVAYEEKTAQQKKSASAKAKYNNAVQTLKNYAPAGFDTGDTEIEDLHDGNGASPKGQDSSPTLVPLKDASDDSTTAAASAPAPAANNAATTQVAVLTEEQANALEFWNSLSEAEKAKYQSKKVKFDTTANVDPAAQTDGTLPTQNNTDTTQLLLTPPTGQGQNTMNPPPPPGGQGVGGYAGQYGHGPYAANAAWQGPPGTHAQSYGVTPPGAPYGVWGPQAMKPACGPDSICGYTTCPFARKHHGRNGPCSQWAPCGYSTCPQCGHM